MDAFIDTVEHGIEQTAFFSSYNDAVDTCAVVMRRR